jgi:hypothetical protein
VKFNQVFLLLAVLAYMCSYWLPLPSFKFWWQIIFTAILTQRPGPALQIHSGDGVRIVLYTNVFYLQSHFFTCLLIDFVRRKGGFFKAKMPVFQNVLIRRNSEMVAGIASLVLLHSAHEHWTVVFSSGELVPFSHSRKIFSFWWKIVLSVNGDFFARPPLVYIKYVSLFRKTWGTNKTSCLQINLYK